MFGITPKKRVSVEFKRELKSVVSKTMVKDLCTFIEELVINIGSDWSSETHRLSMVDVFEDYLLDLAEDGDIEQYKVICDKRNNKTSEMDKGIYNLEINFKQKNCLNVTKLLYKVTISQNATPSTVKPSWII